MTALTPQADDERFEFGENWLSFLETVDDDRVAEAERSLREMLGRDSLSGSSFVDVGCGSGLFSLAAVRLGADRVVSLDYDASSVRCAEALRERFAIDDGRWRIERGSALDAAYLRSLGTFDIVYSWGVLHHTGDMERALDNVVALVAPDGALYISIYNDQGLRSRLWTQVKRTYNRLPDSLRTPYVALVMAPRELLSFAVDLVRLKPMEYVRHWTEYKRRRGMSRAHDLVDWVGGYPFEVATPERIFDFYRARGFELERLTTCGGGLGCNQFVFGRRSAPASPTNA